MDYGPYSPLKAANIANHDRLRALAERRVARPAQVHLVITNRCQHSCSFCAYRSSRSTCNQNFHEVDEIPWNPRGRMLIDELALAGAGAVQFTGGGEPTLHPQFQKFYEAAQGHGMDVALVTNGGLLHRIDQAVLQRSAWIRVSLDAATAETHHGIRRSRDFDRVCDNITTLTVGRKRGKGPVVGIGFVVCPDNHEEVGDAIRLAHELGADNIRVSAAFYDGAVEEHAPYVDYVEEQIKEAREQVTGLRIFDLFTDRLADLEQKKPDYKYCAIARLVPYLAADMNLYSCCVMAYSDRGLIGSFENRPFDLLWNDEGADYFSRHDARKCKRCMFNEKNKFLSYMVGDAEHVSFI